MSRPFTLPVVIACSAHALLMLGFKKPEMLTVPDNTACPEPVIRCFPLPLEDPPEATPPAGENVSDAKSAVPPPAAPESFTDKVSFKDIVMDAVRSDNRNVPVSTKITVTGIFVPGSEFDPKGRPEGKGDSIVFSPSSLDSTPRTRAQTSPAYPFSLKNSGISGEVLVEFIVDERGRVVNPRVVSSTHADFEAPTLAAVSKWRFEPGTRKLAPVRFKMVVPVKFNLNE